MMRYIYTLILMSAALTLQADEIDEKKWAVAVKKPGLPNLYKISDQLYRGAQPEDEGFAELKKMGIKTVINLRSFHSDRANCKKHGLKYVKKPITLDACIKIINKKDRNV